MSKVDPMEIMLSDIFDKVFYSKEQEPRTQGSVKSVSVRV
jgi:hypothetical protein